MVLAAGLLLAACTHAAAPPVAEEAPVPPGAPHLAAATTAVFAAPEADQGVAVDPAFFYAIDNAQIVKYDRASGARAGEWKLERPDILRHINSCLAEAGTLICANSNYPKRPMASSVEVFDTGLMAPLSTHSLGVRDEGSLTWVDRIPGGWIAGFAHYDGPNGMGYKDHSASSVVTFDEAWRRTGGWAFPEDVVARMAPHAASGGAIGPDGLLYVLGHDRPELYVLARPQLGPGLILVAVIDIEAEGQAFSWAPGGARQIYAIDRRAGRVLVIDVPLVDIAGIPFALTFR
jgi:hypothetical protein